MGATPLPAGRQVMPFECFPPVHQERIRQAVMAPKPPNRTIDLEFGQIPSRAWYEWHWFRGIDPDNRYAERRPTIRAVSATCCP